MQKPKNFFEQTTADSRETIACLLGFGIANGAGEQPGFRNNLRHMAPLRDRWTYGEATRAYCLHIMADMKN